MTHVTTSVNYPQSNGKLERCNKTIKLFLRTQYIADLDDGFRLIAEFIEYYNNERLHSAIGYVAPADNVDERWHNIGIRIEDDVLIKPSGFENLTEDVAKHPDDIEAVMAA